MKQIDPNILLRTAGYIAGYYLRCNETTPGEAMRIIEDVFTKLREEIGKTLEWAKEIGNDITEKNARKTGKKKVHYK